MFTYIYILLCIFVTLWDTENDTLVVTTHGIIKKTQKTPSKEIKRAEDIRIEYFNTKNRK